MGREREVSGVPRIFDRALYRARRVRAAVRNQEIPLADEAAEALGERLGTVNRRFEHALDLNSRMPANGSLRHLAASWTVATPEIVDEEHLPYAPESFDLVVSSLALHAVNDLPGALTQIRRVLKPDGLFVASLFGGETLSELRQAFAAAELEMRGGASPRIAPFAEVRSLGGLLSRAGFALPVADVERTTIRYSDLARLFADLRSLGETNVLIERSHSLLSPRLLAALAHIYAAQFSDNGKLRATFDIVYLTAWAPHESQQKPLKPGSAKMRLADALGVTEKSVGEKAGK
jgi:SAM-dependent methyltransferase